MLSPDLRQFKRSLLDPDQLWGQMLCELPTNRARQWTADPGLESFGKALAGYLTPLLPASTRAHSSLAVECLSALAPEATGDAAIRQALQHVPALLKWQVFTLRRGVVSVWDPIRLSLSSFLMANGGAVHVAPAPAVEGDRTDPEVLRFLLRVKIEQLNRSQTARSCGEVT